MAKKATTETGEGTSAVRSNGYDPDAVKRFVDRVEALDGRLQVESPPGQGTRIRVVIPCG